MSNEKQQEEFIKSAQKLDISVESMVLPEELSAYKNPIVVKKFYGLRSLYKKYDYIIPVDCECKFFKNVNIAETADNMWKNGEMLSASRSLVGAELTKEAARLTGLDHNGYLCREMENFNYNVWWNDLPVYRSDTVEDFFLWMEKVNILEIVYNNWSCFDYYIYAFYLILEKNKHLIKRKVIGIGSVMEEVNCCSPFRRHYIEKRMKTHWTPNIDFYNNDNIVMFFD